MKFLGLLLTFALAFSSLAFPSNLPNDQTETWLVKLPKQEGEFSVSRLSQKPRNWEHISSFPDGELYRFKSGSLKSASILSELAGNQAVMYAHRDVSCKLQRFPQDKLQKNQWSVRTIGARTLWRDGITCGSGVITAVIDTGVSYDHPDLVAPFAGYNAVTNTDDGSPTGFHGTAVSGVMFAIANNKIGIAGILWSGQLFSADFFGPEEAWESDAIKCMEKCIQLQTQMRMHVVINASWGASVQTQAMRDELTKLRDAGILVIAAAGNDAELPVISPASFSAEFDNVISVGASTDKDEPASYSARDPKLVTLFAPGDNIWTTVSLLNVAHNEPVYYEELSGTSIATPHVTATAVLLWSAHTDQNYQFVKRAILESVDVRPALSGLALTGGRLNTQKAFEYALNPGG